MATSNSLSERPNFQTFPISFENTSHSTLCLVPVDDMKIDLIFAIFVLKEKQQEKRKLFCSVFIGCLVKRKTTDEAPHIALPRSHSSHFYQHTLKSLARKSSFFFYFYSYSSFVFFFIIFLHNASPYSCSLCLVLDMYSKRERERERKGST